SEFLVLHHFCHCVDRGFESDAATWRLRLFIRPRWSHFFPDGRRRRRLVVRWRWIQRIQRRRRQFWWGRGRFELVAKCERRNFSVSSNTIGSSTRSAKPNQRLPVKSAFIFSAANYASIHLSRRRRNFIGSVCTKHANAMPCSFSSCPVRISLPWWAITRFMKNAANNSGSDLSMECARIFRTRNS